MQEGARWHLVALHERQEVDPRRARELPPERLEALKRGKSERESGRAQWAKRWAGLARIRDWWAALRGSASIDSKPQHNLAQRASSPADS